MLTHTIDAHCHADLLLERDGSFPEQYRKRLCGGISWSFADGIASWKAYPEYWERLRSAALRLRDDGICFYYLVGIHPRCIPDDLQFGKELPLELFEAMHRHVNDSLCLGLGEIGLEEATDVEARVLRWQLDLALDHLPDVKRIGVHTPKGNKVKVTQAILALLKGYPQLKERVLIDHVTPETYQTVRDQGFCPVGMTVQQGKTSVTELSDFIRDEPSRAQSLIVNSDSAVQVSDWFLNLLDNPDVLTLEQRRWLMRNNARSFFNI